MARKYTPVAHIDAEDYLWVSHTHDLDIAIRLMVDKLVSTMDTPDIDKALDRCLSAEAVWVRKIHALKGSWAKSEGLAYQVKEYDKPAPGAFAAVVFRP